MHLDTHTFESLGHGIWRIDTGLYRARHAACYLVNAGTEAAFVDTGTSHTVPRLLELLDSLGLTRNQVRYVIPTHVHLDHAGGAGALMAHLPDAELVVHAKGARHMVDPAKLQAGAVEVYGDAEFAAHFGELVPVPERRVVVAEDGMTIDFGGRRLEFLDTPGHANHHGCIFDPESRGFFTGDTFGVRYPDLAGSGPGVVFAPTTPVAFDPEAWHRSLDRLMTYRPQVMYVTHFGAVTALDEHLAHLRRSIDDHRRLALTDEDRDDDARLDRLRAGVEGLLRRQVRDAGLEPEDPELAELLGGDIVLNAQGLAVWLARRAKARAGDTGARA